MICHATTLPKEHGDVTHDRRDLAPRDGYRECSLSLDHKHPVLAPAGLFTALVLIYLFSPSATELVDGLALALRMADPGAVAPHPHHLLTELPARALWFLASRAGWPGTILATAHLYGALAAALIAVGVYQLAQRLGALPGQALAAGAMTGLMRGPWMLGSMPDAVTLGSAVALFALAEMVRSRAGKCYPYRSALLAALAALLHQSQALLIIPLLASVPGQSRLSWFRRLGLTAVFALPFTSLYLLVPWLHGVALERWPAWAGGYVTSERWWSFEPWLVPVNLARLAVPPVGAPWAAWSVGALLVAALLAWSAYRALPEIRKRFEEHAPALWALAGYLLFTSVWATSDPLFTIPLLCIAMAFVSRGFPLWEWTRTLPWIAVTFLLVAGFSGERPFAPGPSAGGRGLRRGLVERAEREAAPEESIVLLTSPRPAEWKVAVTEALSTSVPVFIMYEEPWGWRSPPRLSPPPPPWYIVHVAEAVDQR